MARSTSVVSWPDSLSVSCGPIHLSRLVARSISVSTGLQPCAPPLARGLPPNTRAPSTPFPHPPIQLRRTSPVFRHVCAKKGAADLNSSSLATDLLALLRQHVEAELFALLAYCFMPNHLHLALEGLSEASDLRRLVSRWKQVTGYRYKQEHRQTLWMPGYHDRVLRDGEPTMNVVQYALRNPVRAGLAASLGDYPFAGSDVFGEQELREILGAGLKACSDR